MYKFQVLILSQDLSPALSDLYPPSADGYFLLKEKEIRNGVFERELDYYRQRDFYMKSWSKQ